MNDLEKQIDYVINELTNKLLPDNLKKGTNILGVEGNFSIESLPEYEDCLKKLNEILGKKKGNFVVKCPTNIRLKTPLPNQSLITTIETKTVPTTTGMPPCSLAFHPLKPEDYLLIYKNNITPEEREKIMKFFIIEQNGVPFMIMPDGNNFNPTTGELPFQIMIMNQLNPSYICDFKGHFEIPLYGVDSTGELITSTIIFDFE